MKYSVLVERIHYTPLFRTFEANSRVEAEAMAQAAVDADDPVIGVNGWTDDGSGGSVEFEVRTGETTQAVEEA